MDETEYDEMDLKIINFIKIINNKENEKIPEPKYFTISTQSAMCNIDNINNIDLSKIVVNISKNIIKNIVLKQNTDYLIRGIVVDNIIIRYDESYLKKYKKPYIKYLGNIIDINNSNECLSILNDIHILENNSLKKHGRQKKKKDNEYFYNSCSIIVKASLDIKCVNIKLFNNGRITLTGSKNESDGYYASCVLLDELKKDINIFPDLKQDINLDNNTEIFEENTKKNIIFNNLKIVNYKITMINSDFNTNFKIDLIKLLNILNNSESELFTKFNPEKYRGLIIGYYWNTNKKIQDGRCFCKSKCNGKGTGTGDGQCKKITISIFKSGSVIITGGRLVKQIEDAYSTINDIFKENYHEINKLSILDFIDQEEDANYEDNEDNEEEEDKKIYIKPKKDERKIIKIKNILNK
jgi:TATA-box binding protein (TBP) (component of TFIID and TFIIIB)